jgi:hypothetical protein
MFEDDDKAIEIMFLCFLSSPVPSSHCGYDHAVYENNIDDNKISKKTNTGSIKLREPRC